jgi:threonylcarbamoyladenosine tRNA methylthiotransferase MtaB
MIDRETFGTLTADYVTLGCKLNFAETSTVARLMADHGISRVHAGDCADIVVVNTCSVTAEADKKCRQAIRHAARRHPGAAIIVTGCYAQLRPDEVAAIPGVVIVAGNDRKGLLTEYLDNWLAQRRARSYVTPADDITSFTPSCSRGDRTRYFLKVQDGCDYRCSYCTIPMARGRSRSASIAEIVGQAREVAAEGGREIVITGVNIGDFGRRAGHGETFFDLCRALDEVDGIERYRISSIEPNLLTDPLIEWLAGESQRFMPHFHIPLQSGSDAVLRLMGRRYTTELFRHKIEEIRRLIPDAFIGVDLITGARGETPELFEASREFVDSLDISRLHVFPYSERRGTRALGLDAFVVPEAEKHRRARAMIALSEAKLRRFSERFTGAVRPVLLEHIADDGSVAGFTDNYLRVELPDAAGHASGDIVGVRLGKPLGNGDMAGEVAV